MKYIGIDGDNSYCISGYKTVVIECTQKNNADHHIENIKTALGGERLDYIVLNHTSPENTGSLELLMSSYPEAVIVASAAGVKNLSELLNRDFEYIIAKDNKELDLGEGKKLCFKTLPNLPWTDTMASYYDGNLFCGSIFSAEENYLKKLAYRGFAKMAAQRLSEINIKRILPLKGKEITDVSSVINEYMKEEKNEKFAVVVYYSNYGFTAEMAQVICDAFGDMSVKCFDAAVVPCAEIVNEINKCTAFVVGTNTVNRNAAAEIWNIISGIDLVNKRYTPCFVFGSCGWSGDGVYLVERQLKNLKMKCFDKPYLVNFKMSDGDKNKLAEHTARFIEFINNEGE